MNRINQVEHNFDSLATARPILQTLPVLTYDQLSWPADRQMEGADGGAYLASAQLFQYDLLQLKNGREKMRDLLQKLPAYMNWQTPFFLVFGNYFKQPLDVEKWWALQVVNFVARAPGPRWTTDVSLARLDELMSVPVEFRSESNALPSHAEISLQDALKNLEPAQRETVLRTKVRDFAVVEFLLSPPYGDLADGYRTTLTDFLGESKPNPRANVTNRHASQMIHKAGLADTLARLDALDRRRREAETRTIVNLSGNLRAVKQ